MRMLIQRVKEAQVIADGELFGKIEKGVLVFFGVHRDDSLEQTSWLAQKLVNLRIFEDDQGKMNRSVQDIGGEVLIISQFTLYGDCTCGRRPDFGPTKPPCEAEEIYNQFVSEVKELLGKAATGKFGAYMEVSLINDGPVTFLVEKK